MAKQSKNGLDNVGNEGGITNGGKDAIESSIPYIVNFKLQGTSDLLFHRWNVEGVAAKAAAAKGSQAKKTDDVETYIWRDEQENICLPGEYVRQSMIHAAKFRQDPRSPRKSAMDLFKAGLVSLTQLAPFHSNGNGHSKEKPWDYLHAARVVVQRNGVTRVRPAMRIGWNAEMQFLVNLPEYIRVEDFRTVLGNAGKLIGVGDFRPSYGRFDVVSIEAQQPEV